MMIKRRILVLAILTLILAIAAYGQAPPPSASVGGVTNSGWPSGISNVNSYGQIVQQRALVVQSSDANIDSTAVDSSGPFFVLDSTAGAIETTDVLVRSGVATQTAFVRINTTGSGLSLEPFITVNNPVVLTSVLCGTGYQVGIQQGGRLPSDLRRNADRITLFTGQDDAFATLQAHIAQGIPVVVDVDFFFLFDQAVTQEPGIAAQGKQHVSRFIVVTGYDPNNVFFTDNGPVSELGSSGEDIQVTVSSFLQAWSATKTLKTKQAVAGPFFMMIATSKPSLTSAPFTLAFDGESGAGGPDKIRLVSRVTAAGKDPAVALQDSALFSATRLAMAEFTVDSTQSAINTDYQTSSALWGSLADSTSSFLIPGILDRIAAVEDQGLAAMRAVDSTGTGIELLGPPDGTATNDLTAISFRWAALPEIGKTVLEISSTDTSTGTRSFTLTPRSGRTFILLTPAQAAAIMSTGAATLTWHVSGVGAASGIVTEDRTIFLNTTHITAISPPNGTLVTETTLPTFVFEAPGVVTKPRVVMSTSGDFNDPKSKVILPAKPGSTEVTMTKAVFNALEHKKADDTDRTVSWRVEDGAAAKTRVGPSNVLTFVLQ